MGYMRKAGSLSCVIGVSALISILNVSKSEALSSECQDLNGTYSTPAFTTLGQSQIVLGTGKDLNSGETITFNWSSSSPNGSNLIIAIQLKDEVTNATQIIQQHTINNTTGAAQPILVNNSISMPSTSTYNLILAVQGHGSGQADAGTITVSCSIGTSAELLNAVSTQVNKIGQKSVNRLVGGRIRQIQRAPGSVNAISAPDNVTTSGLSHQLNQQNGKNAGAPDYASGVWGNIALTHFGDHHRPTNMSGLQGTGVFGIDTRVMDNLVIGGAVNLEYASIDLGANDGEITSTAFGVSPYVSWQIDDIFSLTGLANISHIHSRMAEQQVAGVISETDMNGVRWNVAVNGDGFFTWDNWSLLTGVQLSYGQLWNFSAKDNAGIRVAGSDAKSGSATFLVQPAYYWQYSRNLGLEPYLLAEYQYDFTMEKVTTPAGAPFHSNDEDQFRLGAGLNIFGGAFYSGNVEASAVVGREDYTEATISSNIRINF